MSYREMLPLPARLLRAFAGGLVLILLLGMSMQSCQFIDLLTALYTGTYVEFATCPLGPDGCETVEAALDECRANLGPFHPDCRQIHDEYWDCHACAIETALAEAFSQSASKQGAIGLASTAARADADDPDELFWSNTFNRISRTTGGMSSVDEIIDFGRFPVGLEVDPVNGKVYWSDARTGGLRRADLDGTGKEYVVTGIAGITGIAVDAARGAVYWGNTGEGTIQKLDLVSMNVTDVASGLTGPTDVAVDPTTGTIYWIDNSTTDGRIERLQPAGAVEELIVGLTMPFGLALDPAAGLMYWSDPIDGAIRRAGLDGSGSADVLTGLDGPGGLDLDPTTGMLYWVDVETIRIRSASVDGSNVQTIINGSPAADLAVDAASGKIYWTGWLVGLLSRANLDGTGFETLDRPARLGGDLAVAPALGKIYWTMLTTGMIQRSNFDGSNVEDIGSLQFGLGDIAFDRTRSKLYWTASGDVLRSDPDGSNPETVVTGIVFIGDILIDEVGEKLYWVNRFAIQRANLDGTNVETFYTEPSGLPSNLAMHEATRMLYWSLPFDGVVRRAHVDGIGDVIDVVTGALSVRHIVVSDDYLFWSVPFARTIRRGDLDGAAAADFLVRAIEVSGLALAPVAPSEDPPDPVDSDGDGVVDDSDNCVLVPNADQEDSDGDGIGDACDPDRDGDGIDDAVDNCPAVANADQEDSDGDGIGNACDPVDDGDDDEIVEACSDAYPDLLHTNFSPIGNEFFQVMNTGDRPIDLDGCHAATWNPFTEKVIWSAALDGIVSPGETFTIANAGGDFPLPRRSMTDGPGATTILSASIAIGETVQDALGSVVSSMIYLSPTDVFIQDPAAALEKSDHTMSFQEALAKVRESLPDRFALEQNYPNPFNPATVIPFHLPEDAHVRIDVFDALGRTVATLVDEPLAAGRHAVEWEARDVASGMYVYRIQAGSFTATRRMAVQK